MLQTADQSAIVAENASKLFLDGAVVAFHQLSLEVKRNEIMCVVGPSGCGKTTLLRCIAGLTDLSSGQFLVHGKPVAGRLPDGVAMVFQHFGLLPWKTVLDNAAFGLAMAGVPRAEIKTRVTHYLELVGLTGFEGHYPYQLSGGMQQRVGLVRALAMNPSILLMDEPFAALDAQTREILQEELLLLMERPRRAPRTARPSAESTGSSPAPERARRAAACRRRAGRDSAASKPVSPTSSR